MVTLDSETKVSKKGLWSAVKAGLSKTRQGFARLFAGKQGVLDEQVIEELEAQLLLADVGVAATADIMQQLHEQVKLHGNMDMDEALVRVKAIIKGILHAESQVALPVKPTMILLVGINGAGKTTTVGKLAHFFTQQGKKVLLAAGDTYRAAAIAQLQEWGARNQVPVIAQQDGADPAAVIFDAYNAAIARSLDVVIADTAGRLHTQQHLMAELHKIRRVLQKIDPSAPHEVLLVLDGTIGQNAINQAKQFESTVGVTGLVLTKLDGSAKGGVVVAISQQLAIPIKFIGLGEKIADLQPFVADSFVDALFAD